jgi:hypothetical protein
VSWLDNDGSDEFDPLIMSPQVEAVLLGPDTPMDIVGALATAMVALREALDAGVLPPDAMPVPGIDAAFLLALPHGLGMLEFHQTQVEGQTAAYLSRVVRTDTYPGAF